MISREIKNNGTFSDLLEKTDYPVFILEASNGKIIDCNKTASQTFQAFSKSKLKGLHLDHFSANGAYFKTLKNEIKAQGIFSKKVTLISQKGQPLEAELIAHKISAAKKMFYVLRFFAVKHLKKEKQPQAEKKVLDLQKKVLLSISTKAAFYQGNFIEAAKEISKASAQTIEVEKVGVWLFNEEGTKIKSRTNYSLKQDRFLTEQQEIIAEKYPNYFRALKKERTLVAHDVSTDPRMKELYNSYCKKSGISSMLDVPVRLKGKVIGILCHEHKGDARQWTLEEERFAATMADMLSLAMESAERRNAEDTLKKLVNEFQSIAENSPVIISKLLPNGTLIYVNKVLDGFDKENVIGTSVYDYIEPGYVKVYKKAINTAVRTGRRQTIEIQGQGANRELRWYHTIMTPIKVDKKVDHILLITTDTTERKEAEEGIQISEQSYRDLFNHSLEQIYIFDASERMLDVNQAVVKGIGYTKTEIKKRGMQLFTSSQGKNAFKTGIKKAWKGEQVKLECDVLRNGKPEIPMEFIIYKGNYFGEEAIIVSGRDVLDRKRSEQILKRNEEQFKNLFELAPIGMGLVDMKGKFIRVNRALRKLTGYTEKELLKRNFIDITHPDDVTQNEYFRKKLLKGEIDEYQLEKRYIRSDNEIIYAILRASLERDSEGEPLYIVGQIVDITNFKKSQEATQLSEKNYRELFNNSSDLLFIQDKNGTILDVNQAVIDKYGYKKDKILGKKPQFIGAPGKNDLKKSTKAIEKAWKGAPQVLDWWGKNKQGEELPMEFLIRKGEYFGKEVIIASGRDRSERVEYEEKLKTSEHRYRSLFENNLAGVFRADAKGKIIECNNAFAHTLGYLNREEVLRKRSLNLFFSEAYKQKYESDLKKKGTLTNYEVCYRKKGGSKVWAIVNVFLYQDTQTKEVLAEGTFIDITELKRTNLAIKESEERFRLLSEVTLEGILFSDGGRVLDANDQFAKLHGFESSEEVLGKRISELIVPEDLERYKKIITDDPEEKFEIRSRKKDGSVIVVESKGRYIPYNGKMIRVSVIYDITDRKQIEEELKERERAMSTLLGHLPGMAYRAKNDKKRTMEFISEGCKDVTGYDPLQIIYNNKVAYSSIIHPKFRDSYLTVQDNIEAGQPYNFEYQIIDAAGKTKWVWEQGEAVFGKQGEIVALEGYITDVTDRIKYENELQKAKETYQNLVEFSPDSIFIHINGIIKYINPSGLKLLGEESMERLLGKNFSKLFVAKDRKVVKKGILDLKSDKIPALQEVRLEKSGGEVLDVGIQSVNTIYEGERATHSTLSDLTLQKQLVREQIRAKLAEEINNILKKEIKEHERTQQKLRSAQRFTRSIIESSLDMIIALDHNGIITEFNKAAQKKFGATQEEVIGQPASILFADEAESSRVDKALSEKGVFTGEIVNKAKNGKLFTTFLSASLLRDHKGNLVGSMGVSRDISDIKKQQEKLKISEERYRDLFENAMDVIQSIDKEGNFIYVNRAWKKAMKYASDEIDQLNFFDLVKPGQKRACKQQFKRLLAGEKVGNIKLSIISKKNKEIILEGNSSVRHKDGEAHAIRSIFRDITSSEQAKRKAHKQTARIESIFESSSHMFWTVNKAFMLTSFNKNFSNTSYEAYGVRPKVNESIVLKSKRYISDFEKFWKRKYAQALQGKPQYFETCINDNAGKETWQEVFLHPIYGLENKVEEVSGIAHDITYKKQAERKIKDQAAKINSIFESTSNMMIWSLDNKARITSYNKKFQNTYKILFGQNIQEDANFIQLMKQFMDDKYRPEAEDAFKTAVLGKPLQVESLLKDVNGNKVWFEVFMNPIKLEMGKVREISCLAHEITDKKVAERQIRNSLKEKEVLLKEVHHRVKNNLQVISSILNLQSAYVKDQNTINILMESQNRIKSMSFIHESLYQAKDFSSIDFSNYILSLSKNLLHSYSINEGQIELVSETENVFLNLDQAIPCGLIVNEIVSNALKYAFPENQKGKVYVGIKEENNKIHLEVGDDGVGMSKKYDLENADTLGLQLVYTLTEQLDGTINLSNQKGTRYKIIFGKT